jgi:adenylyltransferase/sulfurtransferase
VFAPLTGIVGCMQAAEALKLAAATGLTLSGKLMIIDVLAMQWRTLKIDRDPACPVCGAG